MAGNGLTAQEYELHLQDLCERLRAFLERGEGSLTQLRKDAEQVLLVRGDFPDVYARHPEVEGLIAEMLARQEQRKFTASGVRGDEPGCLLGWLVRRRRR